MIDPSALTDEELIEIVREDIAAFRILYDRYAPFLQRYVCMRVERQQDAEDVVSATFMQALSRIDTFDPERGSFAAWLFAIARNLVRMAHRRPDEITLDALPERSDGGATPQDAALEKEQVEAVTEAVQRLAPKDRDVLALRYVAEMPFADIARRIGTSEVAAKMRVKRALKTLRRYLSWNEPLPALVPVYVAAPRSHPGRL